MGADPFTSRGADSCPVWREVVCAALVDIAVDGEIALGGGFGMAGAGTPPVAGADLVARMLGLPGVEAITAHAGTLSALTNGKPQMLLPARVTVR